MATNKYRLYLELKKIFEISIFILFVFPTTFIFAADNPLKLTGNGIDKAFLPYKPWSGYWWSRKEGKLVKGWKENGNISPFKKYDMFVTKLTGKNPNSYEWEANPKNGHYYKDAEDWAGHCNGWAAASIMEPEPKKQKTLEGINFTIGDQKGLLTELWMDCRSLFYGKRKNDNFPISLDIAPNIFHRLLVENIKRKKRGIVADISNGKAVWNFPIYGYQMNWTRKWWLPSLVFVTTTVYYVDDRVDIEYVGTKLFTKTYHYILQVNRKGEIISGYWDPRSLWDHPDFIWIPLFDWPSEGGENPRINPEYVYQITNDLTTSTLIDTSTTNYDAALIEAGINPESYFNSER